MVTFGRESETVIQKQ